LTFDLMQEEGIWDSLAVTR